MSFLHIKDEVFEFLKNYQPISITIDWMVIEKVMMFQKRFHFCPCGSLWKYKKSNTQFLSLCLYKPVFCNKVRWIQIWRPNSIWTLHSRVKILSVEFNNWNETLGTSNSDFRNLHVTLLLPVCFYFTFIRLARHAKG